MTETKRVLETGIEIRPLYSQEDTKALDYKRDIGLPGEYPYTRGIH